MAFDYYCTNCGKKITEETELFDLAPLFFRNETDKWTALKLRMTGEEFRKWYDSGVDAGEGFHQCSLTFPRIMELMTNDNNLNYGNLLRSCEIDMNIVKSLSLEQLRKFIGVNNLSVADDDDDEDEDDDEDDFNEDGFEEKSRECAPISELLKINLKVQNNVFTESTWRDDFKPIKNAFSSSDKAKFVIIPELEKDENGNDVLVGYRSNIGGDSTKYASSRVCPKCGGAVFQHAGTAPHKTVVFIGGQMSGKTSTILALTHYAQTGLRAVTNEIWGNAEQIKDISSIQLISPSEKIKSDLVLFGRGIGPGKTSSTSSAIKAKGEQAYSATFLIRNNANENYLLTITDLPGDLFLNNDVQENLLENRFEIVFSGEAYIVCYDTLNEGGYLNQDNDVCRWTDYVQSERVKKKYRTESTESMGGQYVPIMLLFTKCKDFEEGTEECLAYKKWQDSVDRMYCFNDERAAIKAGKNQRFESVCENFEKSGGLNKAYSAMLRCSPYGYHAPSQESVKNGKSECHIPEPKNIDRLMRWILEVSGCIPVKCKYQAIEGDGSCEKQYQLKRFQHRAENPIDDTDEAFARCTLFRNPGCFDRNLVETDGDKRKKVISLKKAELCANHNINSEIPGLQQLLLPCLRQMISTLRGNKT